VAACNTDPLFYVTEAKKKWARKWWFEAATRVDQLAAGAQSRDEYREITQRPVLFIAGPTSRDVGRALKYGGFNPWQLMAVDVETQNVLNVRKRGIAARLECIKETVKGWPRGKPLGFVSADVTWAPGQNYLGLIDSLLVSGGVDENTVVGFNVAAGNLTRAWEEHRESTKDRGIMMLGALIDMGLDRAIRAGYIKENDRDAAAQEFISWADPVFFDRYKRHSRAMPMDSIQFRFPFPAWNLGDRRNTQSIRGSLAHMTKSKPCWSWDTSRDKWVYTKAA
jgi:hypothetical protein